MSDFNTVRKINVNGKEVILDSSRMEFNESTLPEFMANIARYYDNFCHNLAIAEYLVSTAKDKYNRIYGSKFSEAKEGKVTEKVAESIANNDPEVIAALEMLRSLEYNVSELKLHLRSWDKAHENAQNRGHTLRKEWGHIQSANTFGE